MSRAKGAYRPPTFGAKRKRLVALLKALRAENIRRGRIPAPAKPKPCAEE